MRGLAALGAATVVVLAPGCRREEVTHYRVPKAAAPAQPGPPGQAPTVPAGMTGDVPAPPSPGPGGGLQWTLPKGWTQDRSAGGMRYATLKPSVPGKLDVSVVVLPGPAGGELANVNRWRGQIGLPPIDEGALAAQRKVVKTRAGPVSVFDFTSEGAVKTRVVAGLTEAAGSTWFIKMTGDAAPVAAAQPAFLHLLESLHLD